MQDERKTKINRKVHPKHQGYFLKHFFFCWQIPIFLKGWKEEITEDNLYQPLKEYSSKDLGDKLEKAWLQQKNKSLPKAIVRVFGREIIIFSLIYIPVDIAVLIFQPYFLTKLLDFFNQNETVTKQHAYIYSTYILLLCLIRTIFFNYLYVEMSAVGMKVRIACSSLIYRNILKIKKFQTQQISLGQIINLLSNDVNKFDNGFLFLCYLLLGPLELIVSVLYVQTELNYMGLIGLGPIFLYMLSEVLMTKQVTRNRRLAAQKSDVRISLLSSVLSGIKILKMYNWEKIYAEMIESAKNLENKKFRLANYFRLGINSFQFYMTPLIIFSGVVALYLTNQLITSQFIYSLETLYDSLIISLIILTPLALIHLSEMIVSVKRIQEFLQNIEFKPETKTPLNYLENQSVINYTIYENELRIFIQNLDSYCNSKKILSNITFLGTSNELIAVIGPTGSGKTTLLETILKEIRYSGGLIFINGSVSYASQDSWVFSSTIRQNILFGEKFDFDKYKKVVQICALERDFSIFPNGDGTLVGDSGVMLSGGQKARINLARAIYKNADIYLLDDPLSAVDPHVARHIFDECITKYLRDKCVVLVTHQIHLLQSVKKIYILENGKIQTCESYHKLIGLRNQYDIKTNKVEKQEQDYLDNYIESNEVKEHRNNKRNRCEIVKRFCLFCSNWFYTLLIVLVFIINRFLIDFTEYFLSFWVNKISESQINFNNLNNTFFYIYVALMVSVIITTTVAILLLVNYTTRGATNLHKALLNKIIYCPMTFFNQHSLGRILNRFTKDLGDIDDELPMNTLNLTSGILLFVGTLILVCISNVWMIFISFLFLIIVFVTGAIFQSTNLTLKRTEGITKSFVFTHLTATLQGLPTIKAGNCETKLIEEFDNHQDLHTSAFYLLNAIFFSFGFGIDLLYVLFIGFVMFGFFLIPYDFADSSVGVAISNSLGLVGFFQYIVKIWGEVETHMTCVERIVEYVDLPSEDDKGQLIPKNWPTQGNINYISVSMRYLPDKPLVLKNLNFHIKSGEKIGIVGRTGAGKTSIISSLFRLFHFEGSILIDEINTKNLPLKVLRSKISVIPQDPIFFVGTLRQNLDPYNLNSDAKIWRILQEMELNNFISDLNVQIAEGGANFSTGQKQLLCLVRAILRNNLIIILDEATANVDFKTDKMIQKIVKEKFSHCTILTIAHRVTTVLNSDKILVMENGCVLEFDKPSVLLRDRNSRFYGFVNESAQKNVFEKK